VGGVPALVMALPRLFLSCFCNVCVQEKLPDLIPYLHWDSFDYRLEARAFYIDGFMMVRFTLNDDDKFSLSTSDGVLVACNI
jgi:hypothetical protein